MESLKRIKQLIKQLIPLPLLRRVLVGRKMRVKNAYAKAKKYEAEVKELEMMVKNR